MTGLRVLIGCETSGVVRRAFERHGHDTWSCDLRPAEDGSNKHITGDLRDVLGWGWDLLAVMHPPCTRLCNSGVRWLIEPPGRLNPAHHDAETRAAYLGWTRDQRLDFMHRDLEAGADFFAACNAAPIPHRAIENPVMHKHARARIPNLPKPQIVQPWWFGEPFFKATGLYLHGLPPLTPTDRLTPPAKGTPDHKAWSAVHRAPPGPNRWQIRSRTFEGIADAMAAQWGRHAMQARAAA
jgi:hypothetical protein